MQAVYEIADWWDEQHSQAKQELDAFVDNNPNLFGVVVATATSTAMEVGSGLVDILRFGQGLAEGGVGGVVKDTLRLIGLAGSWVQLNKRHQSFTRFLEQTFTKLLYF